MASDLTEHTHPVPLPNWLSALCRIFAGIGGIALLAMMMMTVVSVTMRSTLGAPISGDFELVEIGSAVAIFCFLPWCQSTGRNVLVDFFTQKASDRSTHLLDALGDLAYFLIAALLTWRLVLGGMEMREYHEQSMLLHIPVWWSFIIILPAMGLLTLTCAATMVGHVRLALAKGARA